LLQRLGEKGLHHRNAASTDDLVALLGKATKLDRVAVLVYSSPGTDTARRLLEALDADYSDVPVIVVVNEPNIEEHYELMSQGAYDYFGFSEGAAVIEEAVRWAAKTDAVSARAAARRSGSNAKDPSATDGIPH
jgi:DNA-binding NtrC family response regulator